MITLIAACSQSRQIGYKNELLIKLENDMRRFRLLTTNNYCVFGRKTFESIGKALPNRHNLILTKNKKYKTEGYFIYHSVEDILKEYYNYGEGKPNLFICGGEEVYKAFLPYCDAIELTIIDTEFPKADAHFPELNRSEWSIEAWDECKADEKNPYNHRFIRYKRINTK
jgi:dihydrofolate reductase